MTRTKTCEYYMLRVLVYGTRKEGNVLFNDTLNIFYLQVYERKEGNVLLIDALNIFYLQLYGVKTYGKEPLR